MDTISDMLTRIRNAQAVRQLEVAMPFSKAKMDIAKILQRRGYIENASKESKGNMADLRIILKYEKISANKKAPAITGIQRISKLGRRVYIKKGQIRKIKNGYGISIISTSRGVMAGDEARKQGVGGEIICEVW